MYSLFEETMTVLANNGKTIDDVVWVGCWDFQIDKNVFLELSKSADYDPGYGAQEVAEDLIIVGDDWWMERHEYDGSERWVFNKLPKQPQIIKEVTALTVHQSSTKSCGWCSLKELNEPSDETEE